MIPTRCEDIADVSAPILYYAKGKKYCLKLLKIDVLVL